MTIRYPGSHLVLAAAVLAATASAPAFAQGAGEQQAGAPFAHGPAHAAQSAQPQMTMPTAPAPEVMHHAAAPELASPAAQAIDPQAREAWIAECGRRLSNGYENRWERKHDRRTREVRQSCTTYLDDYYAYYAWHARAMQPQTQVYMVPATVQARGAPACTETIVEDVDVPVRPRARRLPSKRIRVTPDKRIRVQ